MRNYPRQGAKDQDETHITSVLVQCLPEGLKRIAVLIDGLPGAEVQMTHPEGKLVMVLETGSLAEVTATVDQISEDREVMSATMIYHQIEDSALLDQPVEAPTNPTDDPLHQEACK